MACAAAVDRRHIGGFPGGVFHTVLSAGGAVGSVVVVVVFSFLEFAVEYLGVVDDYAVEQAVEFFGVDAV